MSSGPDLSRISVREPPPPKAKRFYKAVTLGEEGDRFSVLLDGRPLRTPLKKVLDTPSRVLAEALVAEWDAQTTEIDPLSMPLTRLTSTALDRIDPEREAIIEQVVHYAETDLLCYRAPHPADLKARQHATWQPILDWLEAGYGIGFAVVEGIVPVTQPEAAHTAAARAVGELSLVRLTALQAAVGAMGSLALGLALVQGRISAQEAFAASQLDEVYQNETWGQDEEALRRQGRIADEIEAIGRYLALAEA